MFVLLCEGGDYCPSKISHRFNKVIVQKWSDKVLRAGSASFFNALHERLPIVLSLLSVWTCGTPCTFETAR